MTRTEIKLEAKKLVADKGAYLVLEFGSEFVEENFRYSDVSLEDQEAILEESIHQANRVLDFLGL